MEPNYDTTIEKAVAWVSEIVIVFIYGAIRARSHCRFVPPLIHFIPDSLKYSVPLLLKRQCDPTPGAIAGLMGSVIISMQVMLSCH